MAIWSQEGNTYSESNGWRLSRVYGSNNNDMTNTAVGNINKTPGLGLTKYNGDGTRLMVSTMLSMQLT